MNTRKKKFKIHTGSVSEIALFVVNFQEKAEKNKFFKVCLVGTLNLCLKVPDKMQGLSISTQTVGDPVVGVRAVHWQQD